MNRPPKYLVWSGFSVLMVAAPFIFKGSASLSVLSQIGTAMIFALSYNMLLGQGGMLSFGHTVYSGLGAFCAAHAMNMAARSAIWLPLPLVPLVGGVAGMFFGVLFGYVTTRKTGTTFAMITLGIVELVAASSLLFSEFFGGEAGISTNRVYGSSWLGIRFGPQMHVYYLIAFWLIVSTAAMYAFTRTPLGRALNAVRDNAERAVFIGYDPKQVRYLTFILSAFFAGISGGLSAINFEIVTAENVSVVRSGAVLIYTYLGGVGFFVGPMLGAIVGVFLTVMLSNFTKAWQLYLGLLFIFVVMRSPDGLAGMLLRTWRFLREGGFQRHWHSTLSRTLAFLIGVVGFISLVEMLYKRNLEQGTDSMMTLLGVTFDSATAVPWIVASLLVVLGLIGIRYTQVARSEQA